MSRRRPNLPVDVAAELDAMATIAGVLESLDEGARRRVLDYFFRRSLPTVQIIEPKEPA